MGGSFAHGCVLLWKCTHQQRLRRSNRASGLDTRDGLAQQDQDARDMIS
jgi:hypothetical protein